MAALELKDIITEIPYFEGYQKDMDHFISVCSQFNDLLAEDQRTDYVKIVKTRFKGVALAKMQPLDTLNEWNDIKTRIIEKFKRPVTYEHAQEELNNIRQLRNETIEVYGNRIRLALQKLNSASENVTESVEGRRILRTTNEKYAIRKFEQNLLNDNLKIWVSTKNCTTVDSAISYAMQKEFHFNSYRRIRCNYCNIEGHIEQNCRQKQRNYGSNHNQNRPNTPSINANQNRPRSYENSSRRDIGDSRPNGENRQYGESRPNGGNRQYGESRSNNNYNGGNRNQNDQNERRQYYSNKGNTQFVPNRNNAQTYNQSTQSNYNRNYPKGNDSGYKPTPNTRKAIADERKKTITINDILEKDQKN